MAPDGAASNDRKGMMLEHDIRKLTERVSKAQLDAFERDWKSGYEQACRAYRDKAAKNQAELAEVVARLIDNPSLLCNAGIVKRLPRSDDLEALEHKPVILRALAGTWIDFKTFKSLVEDAHDMQRAMNSKARSEAALALKCAVQRADNLMSEEEGQ